MTSVFRDAAFLGAIVAAISGLLGAVIGAIATYLATTRQYQTEYDTRQRAALAASLLEIFRNQSTLIRELDRVLPLWLSRQHDVPSGSGHLRNITKPIVKYQTKVYDSFFTELIPSRFGPELKTYYDRVTFINCLADDYHDGLPATEFYGYVRALALSVEIADDLARAIHQHVAKQLQEGWGKENDFKTFEDMSERSLYMAALFRTKLQDLEDFIADGTLSSGIPSRITAQDKSHLRPWVLPAREI